MTTYHSLFPRGSYYNRLIIGFSSTLMAVIYLRLIERKEGHSGQDLEQVFE